MKPARTFSYDDRVPRSTAFSVDDMADLLDTRFKGPFGWRFGLDGLLGLIPGVGDLITNLMALAIVGKAATEGYPSSLLMRMVFNLFIDNVIDSIPVLGNIFDFFWKANSKNISLMRSYNLDPAATERRSFWWVSALLIFLLMGFLLIGVLSIMLVVNFFQWLF